MEAFIKTFNTNLKYVYLLIAIILLILLIWLIKTLNNTSKILKERNKEIVIIKDNLEDANKKKEYISYVNKKTFVSEALLTAVVVNEVVGEQKESGGKHLVKHTARSLSKKGRLKKYTTIPAKFKNLK